jgi:dolichol-phosphate mannosyltransferase
MIAELDIVIPVYNEGANILSVLNSLKSHVRTPLKVLLCYDRDDDNTIHAVRSGPVFPFEVRFVKNRGQGAHGAVVTGFRESTAPAVLVMPSDDDYNANRIDSMMEKFREGCEIVAPSRFMPGGTMVGCRWLKASLVRAAAFLLHRFACVPTHDPTNGFRLFSRRVIQTISLESTQGFTYSLELLAKSHRLGWKVGEVPVEWYERRQGTSRFRVLRWLPHYLVWFFYCFATALSKKPERSPSPKLKAQEESRFFDSFVAAHGDYDVLDMHAYGQLLAAFELVWPMPNEVCVDCGCGTGAFSRRLLQYDLNIVGIDISARSIGSASARGNSGGRETYMVGDIRKLAMPDASADIMLFSGVLHHLPDQQLRREVLAEAFRVLKPGGRIFGFDPSAHSPSMWLYRSPASPLYSSLGKTENEVLLSRDELGAEMKAAGFGCVSVRGIGGITYRYVEGRIARAFLPLYNLYERLLQSVPMEKKFGTFLISTARKPA